MGGVFAVSLKLFKDLIFIDSTFHVAGVCLDQELATILVDTLSAPVVASERVYRNVAEPKTSQLMLN